ncbi:MAG TPA: hypothetical protein VER14_03605 [Phototrophicaceae bacterium]|nr:hypothetical protein [Phototrophicaceae bacterium]
MFTNIQRKVILTIVVAVVSSVIYNTNLPSFAQDNGTQANETNYVNFHSNIEQIKGHIEQAEENRNNNNKSLAYVHTTHPIEEVVGLITIPLNNTEPKLNDTYVSELYSLSNLASSSNNSTNEEFGEQAQSSIDMSNKVIATVIPVATLNDTNHNITVIQDLLTTFQEEYAEGVKDGKFIMMLEYQDGSAFINRANDIFNSTKSITTERDEISALFGNLTNSAQQLKDPSEVNPTVEEINHELSESLTNTGNSTAAAAANEGKSAQDYISNIRSLLNQTISAYSANDTVKANEVATAAYLDNFEHIEASIGEELSGQGEELLRERLRDQINSNAPLDSIRQTVNEINSVLDQAQASLTP